MTEFFWRFNHITPKEGGHDVSVETHSREKLAMKKDALVYRMHELANAPWLCGEPIISSIQHYRLIHGVVGRPLCKFQCTKQLVTAVFDALQARSHAVRAANPLHCDISAGNIILTKDGKGLLIDWEMSKMINERGSRRPHRTGTWQFMSANLLRNPGKHHTLADDLESFLHVLAWMTLRFVPAVDSYDSEDRRDDIHVFDEYSTRKTGLTRGGVTMALLLETGKYPSETFTPKRETHLFALLAELRKPFKSVYQEPPSDADREKIKNIDDPIPRSDWQLMAICGNVGQYDHNMKWLSSFMGFIDTMKKALDKEGWPTDDRADENLPTAASDWTTPQEHHMVNRTSCTQAVWNMSELPGNSKRAASSTLEPAAKHRRGTPAASGAGN